MMNDCRHVYDSVFVLQAEQKMAVSYKTQHGREMEERFIYTVLNEKLKGSVCLQFNLNLVKTPKQRCVLLKPYCAHIWTELIIVCV